jgi:hypothetical protein
MFRPEASGQRAAEFGEHARRDAEFALEAAAGILPDVHNIGHHRGRGRRHHERHRRY